MICTRWITEGPATWVCVKCTDMAIVCWRIWEA